MTMNIRSVIEKSSDSRKSAGVRASSLVDLLAAAGVVLFMSVLVICGIKLYKWLFSS